MNLLLTVLFAALWWNTAATAQVDPVTARNLKAQECRNHPSGLVGKEREQIKAQCGMWRDNRRLTDSGGSFEVLIYPYLRVYLRDDTVVSVETN